MIRIKYLLGALLSLVLICGMTSCGNKKRVKAESQESFVCTLTAADTTEVLNLATQCMEFLKGNQTEEALQMMYFIVDGKPTHLADNQKQKLNSKFRMFPVLQYALDGYNFSSETDNLVKYKIVFFIRSDEDDKTPNTIGFMFVPVRIDGKWYLTIPETN